MSYPVYDYIKDTPLEVLKEKFQSRHQDKHIIAERDIVCGTSFLNAVLRLNDIKDKDLTGYRYYNGDTIIEGWKCICYKIGSNKYLLPLEEVEW